MIIDKLILQDFGTFSGRQILHLTPPEKSKPIILVGGRNGVGKTTLLMAIQLCFFGKHTNFHVQNRVSYLKFLQEKIHRGGGATSSLISLEFRYLTNGIEHKYTISRSWSISDRGVCKEHFEVFTDGDLDEIASDNWPDHVERFLPKRIAPLFFFDGEKIAEYADPELAPELIETAINGLLGLDAIDQLLSDLQILEKRITIRDASKTEIESVENAECDVRKSRQRLDRLKQDFAHINTVVLPKLNKQFERIDDTYQKKGGKYYEDQSFLEKSLEGYKAKKEEFEVSLRKLAVDVLPLSLNRELFAGFSHELKKAQHAKEAQISHKVLKQHGASLIKFLNVRNFTSDQLDTTDSYFQNKLEQLKHQASNVSALEYSENTHSLIRILETGLLNNSTNEAAQLLLQYHETQKQIVNAQALLNSVPTEDAISEIAKKRAALLALVREKKLEVTSLEFEIDRTSNELGRKQSALDKILAKLARAEHDEDDDRRVVQYSGLSRKALAEFRHRVISKHLTDIENHVLESYKCLLHKPELVSKISIDPETFKVMLFDRYNEAFGVEQLSAGEKQLFALSVLWGFAKVSGKPIPIIVDTPLGRLDANHRINVMKHYFPHASQQILILSTDKEIGIREQQMLDRHIGHRYLLQFKPKKSKTRIQEGYFELKGPVNAH